MTHKHSSSSIPGTLASWLSVAMHQLCRQCGEHFQFVELKKTKVLFLISIHLRLFFLSFFFLLSHLQNKENDMIVILILITYTNMYCVQSVLIGEVVICSIIEPHDISTLS